MEYNKIRKSPEKTKAIAEMSRPKLKEEIKSFLGLITFYNRFIPDASTITALLRQLLNDKVVFKWTPECKTAFIKLKKEIMNDSSTCM